MKLVAVLGIFGVVATVGCSAGVGPEDGDAEVAPADGELAPLGKGGGAATKGKVVFSSSRSEQCVNGVCDNNLDLYTMNPDGTLITRLTFTPTDREYMPRWSPDRTKVAYLKWNGTATEICYSTVDSTPVVQTTECRLPPSHVDYISSIAWSSDSSKLLLAADGKIATYEFLSCTGCYAFIYLPQNISPYTYTEGKAVDVSRDGRLAIAGVDGMSLYVGSENGGPVQLVYQDTSGARYNMLGPSWAPNGRSIAFSMAEVAGGHQQLFSISAAGGGFRQLTTGARSSAYPTWSSDSKKIIHQQSQLDGQPTQMNLAQINSDGTGRMALTVVPAGGLDHAPDLF